MGRLSFGISQSIGLEAQCGPKGHRMRGLGQCYRKISRAPESAKSSLSAWEISDNPEGRSPAQSTPPNLLLLLTPSRISSAFSGNHPYRELVQTT